MKFLIILFISVYRIIFINAQFSETQGKRIVNGYEARAEDFPYQAAISVYVNETLSKRCGGSIIGPHTVLTAAHCFDKAEKKGYLSFGSTEYMAGLTYRFSIVKVHEYYNPLGTYAKNDIAVIHTKSAIEPHGTGVPIAIVPLEERRVKEINFTISGFGLTYDDDVSNQRLYYAEMYSVQNTVCEDFFGKRNIFSTMLCAKGFNNQESCGGDSGGPAVYYDSKNNPIQVGILSFGDTSCEKGSPEVYTRVSDYMGWIKNNLY